MAKTKYTIEQIGGTMELKGVSDKDVNTVIAVLKKVSDIMNVKTGTAAEHIEKVENMGIVLSDEQKTEIDKSFVDSEKYDVDMRKSISFCGRQANTVSRLIKAMKKE